MSKITLTIIIVSTLLICAITGLLIWWFQNRIKTHKEYYDEDKKQIKRIYYTHKKSSVEKKGYITLQEN